MAQTAKATVEPLRDISLSGCGLAQLDLAPMRDLDLSPGDLVMIDSGSGRPVLARLATPAPDSDGGAGRRRIGLDRWARRAGRLRTGSLVEVVPQPQAGPVDEVVLRPWSALSPEEGGSPDVLRHLSGVSMPVAVGGIVHVRYRPGAQAGMPYQVVTVSPGPGWVTADTRVEVRPAEGAWLDADVSGFDDVGGSAEQIRLLRELVELPLTRPQVYRELGITPTRGVILHGPTGTGKTRLVHALASEIDAECFYVNGPEILGSMYGETESNLRGIFGQAVRKAPSVIFIDELDALAPQRDRTGSHSDSRIVTQLLSLMDGIKDAEGLIVVATTNRLDAIDRACRRAGRFDRELFVGPPSEAARLEILEVQTRAMPLSASATDHLPYVARQAVGFVGADIKDLCREAALNALRRAPCQWSDRSGDGTGGAGLSVGAEDFVAALDQVEPAVMRSSYVLRPAASWNDLEDRPAREAELLPFALSRLRTAVGASSARAPRGREDRGVVLHGPSGSGKTTLAHALADRCGVTFLTLNGGEVFSKWLGDSEAAVREIFAVASQYAPSIVFLDQLESIAPAGLTAGDPGGVARVLSQLQRDLDMLPEGVLVIAAAPLVGDVHSSITRHGRLGTHVALERNR